ncbi:MAG TPA: thermonuclease family protein [Nitrospinaceae bacterium]|jgi:micrococcal nuclease|nr:thermonuclease family protein [Nitrospinaceae bacterium]
MKTKPLIFLLVLTFLISGSTTASSKQMFGDYEGAIYVKNYDGDTITFNLPNLHSIIGNKIAIRVNGIDAPEVRGKCDKEKYAAGQAKDMVEEFLNDVERIDLKNMERGKYFRIVADVYADGENLAEALLDAGMAVRYDGGKKNSRWCE